ncbi:MAG: hypothetical protein ACYSUM_01000, partial [Planctomycetota bacterium]
MTRTVQSLLRPRTMLLPSTRMRRPRLWRVAPTSIFTHAMGGRFYRTAVHTRAGPYNRPPHAVLVFPVFSTLSFPTACCLFAYNSSCRT